MGMVNFHSGSIGFTAPNIYYKHDIMYLDTIILFVVCTDDTKIFNLTQMTVKIIHTPIFRDLNDSTYRIHKYCKGIPQQTAFMVWFEG